MRKASMLLAVLVLGLVTVLGYAQAPVPFINQPLVPDATAPGGPDFTLTIHGTGFVSGSVVHWNGSALATTFVNGSQLTATVPAADIATAGTASMTVVNPAPGGGTSNVTFFTITANIGNAVGFTLASSPATGWLAYSVAVGDFNGDGKLDLAVANMCGSDPTCNSPAGTVSVLLGDGKGNFTLASSPATGGWATSVAVGDFNGDGKLDLAVANCTTIAQCAGAPGMVSILLGDGTGNFTLASSPATGYWPWSVAVGDFNRDGNLDLAVANLGASSASILLGDGAGNFTLASTPNAGGDPWSLAVGDFNGDGSLDLAVADSGGNTVSILLGDGTGYFTLASSPATGQWPASVAVGDFNQDGNLDLAVANYYSNTVSILLGDGTGNFTLASSPPSAAWPTSLAAGDVNGDGILDLAVATQLGTVSILLGDGTGNFALASSLAAGYEPNSIATGDFNSDGKLDFAVADESGSTVSIVLQANPAAGISPTSLSFGTQFVGTPSGAQNVTLTNTGGETLNITSISVSTNFSQTNTCASTVQAGASCTITVTFQPHGIGTLTGAITITDNASDSPQTISLTGIGTVVAWRPTSVDFGSQRVGGTSRPRTVVFDNRGNRALSIAGVHFSGANAADFAETNTCGSSVPAGASCTFSVTFTPKATGSRTATMGVADNGGGSPQVVALSGTGT